MFETLSLDVLIACIGFGQIMHYNVSFHLVSHRLRENQKKMPLTFDRTGKKRSHSIRIDSRSAHLVNRNANNSFVFFRRREKIEIENIALSIAKKCGKNRNEKKNKSKLKLKWNINSSVTYFDMFGNRFVVEESVYFPSLFTFSTFLRSSTLLFYWLFKHRTNW